MSYVADLLPIAPILVLVPAIVYFVLYQCLKKKRKKPTVIRIISEFILIGWSFVFVYITQVMGFGNGLGEVFNITPFQMFHIAFRYGSYNAGLVWQFLLNILMFMPLGLLLPIVFPRKCASWPRVLLVSFCVTFGTELLQLITQRGTDIDDIIANTAGGLCGFASYLLLYSGVKMIKHGNFDSPHNDSNANMCRVGYRRCTPARKTSTRQSCAESWSKSYQNGKQFSDVKSVKAHTENPQCSIADTKTDAPF